MSLTYHFEFAAPSKTTPAKLERFLRKVEPAVKRLGFSPTMVLKVDFDTPERRQFAQRLFAEAGYVAFEEDEYNPKKS